MDRAGPRFPEGTRRVGRAQSGRRWTRRIPWRSGAARPGPKGERSAESRGGSPARFARCRTLHARARPSPGLHRGAGGRRSAGRVRHLVPRSGATPASARRCRRCNGDRHARIDDVAQRSFSAPSTIGFVAPGNRGARCCSCRSSSTIACAQTRDIARSDGAGRRNRALKRLSIRASPPLPAYRRRRGPDAPPHSD